jgi:hypothetical protein
VADSLRESVGAAFSPKGWESSAQGTVLGTGPRHRFLTTSPKGWESLSQPFGLESRNRMAFATQGGALG